MTRSLAPMAVLAATALLAGGLFSGCSSAPVHKTELKGDPAKEYQAEKKALEESKIIAPGYLLRIRQSADEQVSGEFKVNFKGELKLPYRVKVFAAGLTPEELSAKIQHAYRNYFKVPNSVTVEIVQRDYLIEVRGLVKKPGIYSVKLDTSIEEIIALAGGLSSPGGSETSTTPGTKPEYIRMVIPDLANPGAPPKIRWIRLADYFLKYDIRNEMLWHGGEQLFFQVAGDQNGGKSGTQSVQLMGEVRNPGEYPIQANADLYSYLAAAGGPGAGADMESVTVIHRADNDSSSYNLTKGTAMVDLQPGDVILVKSLQVKPGWVERFGSLIVGLAGLGLSIVIAIATL